VSYLTTVLWNIGCVENELGLRQFLEERGHTYVVTDDKEGPNSELDKHLPDTDIVRRMNPNVAKSLLLYPATASQSPVSCNIAVRVFLILG
jgi:hypothetical protein